jgi:hypothetical protein
MSHVPHEELLDRRAPEQRRVEVQMQMKNCKNLLVAD